MRTPLLVVCCCCAVLGTGGLLPGLIAWATALEADPLMAAVRRGDCVSALNLINPDVVMNDAPTAFLAGRMLVEQICVSKDPAAATAFFAQAARSSDSKALLDLATQAGLGEGREQSYFEAAELCRSSGVDPGSRLSLYSLGYACTLQGVVGRLLRTLIPKDAFRTGTEPLLIEFTPASASFRVRSLPEVRRAPASTGSLFGAPFVDGMRVIGSAWRSAEATVPKVDASRLDNESIDLTIDTDNTLEASAKALRPNAHGPQARLLPGDVVNGWHRVY
jgi:hypothetical protein